jgi:ribosome-associated protein
MATVRELVRAAVGAAEEKKAKDVKAIDMRGLSAVTDYMVIASGSSDTNVRAIADGIREKLLEQGERPFSVEGVNEGSWVLLDYVDFVVHVFHYEKRLFFGLEELWADAKPVSIAAAAERKAASRATKSGAKTGARTAPKPGARTGAAPKKPATKKPAAKKPAAGAKPAKAAVKKTASRTVAAKPKKAVRTAAAVPKPKKAKVPKRSTKG